MLSIWTSLKFCRLVKVNLTKSVRVSDKLMLMHSIHYFNDCYVGKQPEAWKEYCSGKSTPGKHE